jgi:FKBP-type peptidyl-prolyl cis-trans isomerase
MLLRWASAAFGVGLALCAGGCKCSSGVSASVTSSKPASSVAPLEELARSVAATARAKRKTVAELVAPPLTPPADAETGPDGVRYKIVELGVGEPLTENDALHADYSVWTPDGTLVFSTYRAKGPVGATAGFVPRPLLPVVVKLPAGSKAWLWLPASLVHVIREQYPNFPFPESALVVEYEPVEVGHRAPTEPASPDAAPARPASGFAAPDAAGPPKDALVSASGLHFVVLAPGTGSAKPKPDDKVSLRLTLWPVLGLVVERPLFVEKASATTLARAPAGLASVLQTLTVGSVVRVWLPAARAAQVGPVPAGRDAVLDLRLEQLE